jgi:hypothetical protein
LKRVGGRKQRGRNVSLCWYELVFLRRISDSPSLQANNVILSHNSYPPGIHTLHFLVLSMLPQAAGLVSNQHHPHTPHTPTHSEPNPCIRGVNSINFNLKTQNMSLGKQ